MRPSRRAALLCVAIAGTVAAGVGTGDAPAAVPAASCPGITATGDTFKSVGPAGAFWLENAGFDRRGGMWISELLQNKLVRFDAKGNAGTSLDIPNPGASVLGPDGLMYVAFGDSPLGAIPGANQAGVMRFDPAAAHPVLQPYATGLTMANGMAFDAAGNLYVADTTGPGVAKILPGGTVDPSFAAAAPVSGGDGVVIIGGTLYVTLFTDTTSSIATIPLADPAKYTTFTSLSPGVAVPQLLDDAQLGPDGGIYVASGASALLRVDPRTGVSCVVYRTAVPIDSVRFAEHFAPFDPGRDAFLTTQAGDILHVRLTFAGSSQTGGPAGTTPRRIRIALAQHRSGNGRTLRLHVRTGSASRACRSGVTVRVGSHVLRTNASGRAAVTVRVKAGVRRTVSARKKGCVQARRSFTTR